ncbi:hypothetical protein [Alienimonas chondri]|uniref:hypothetical protein n=1 Tax=Alienimonas chondri TaxID=2681879 RepID=UPI0014897685|nr:hypothetical protein [Alienimonas chondri]
MSTITVSVALPAATPPADRPDDRRPFLAMTPSRDGAHVTVETEGEDRFTIRLHKAIEYLRVASRQEQFERQFRVLQKELDVWVRSESSLKGAYLTIRDEALLFVAVMEKMECDPDFEDRLSELDLRLHHDQDLNLIRLNVMAVPAVSKSVLSDFLDREFCLTHAGDGSRQEAEKR